MPAEHPNPYPHPTAEEVAAAPGSREQKAARNIASRAFDGIPRRAFLLGDADHSPVVRGIAEATEVAYRLVDLIDEANLNSGVRDLPTPEMWLKIIDANADLVQLMEDHRC